MSQREYSTGMADYKSLDQELYEAGFIPVSPKHHHASDEGAQAADIESHLSFEDMLKDSTLKKAGITGKERNVLKKYYKEGKNFEEIGLQLVPKVTKVQVSRIAQEGARKLKRILPISLWKEHFSQRERVISNYIVDHFFANHRDRFLMVEYLIDYFLNGGWSEFNPEEQLVLSYIGVGELDLEGVIVNYFKNPYYEGFKKDPEYDRTKASSLVASTLNKIFNKLTQKFGRI